MRASVIMVVLPRDVATTIYIFNSSAENLAYISDISAGFELMRHSRISSSTLGVFTLDMLQSLDRDGEELLPSQDMIACCILDLTIVKLVPSNSDVSR